MMMTWWDMNGRHWRTVKFKKGDERKRRRPESKEERAVIYRAFSPYGCPLEIVTSFKYLGWMISAADNDWLGVVINLANVQVLWRRLTRILVREG